MKVFYFTSRERNETLSDALPIVLSHHNLEVLRIANDIELDGQLRQFNNETCVLLYNISKKNFNECYQSLLHLNLQAKSQGNTHKIMVIAEQSLTNEDVGLLSAISGDVLMRPLDMEAVLTKITQYDDVHIKGDLQASNDNTKTIYHSVCEIKSQLTSIKNGISYGFFDPALHIEDLKNILHLQIMQMNNFLSESLKGGVSPKKELNVAVELHKICASHGLVYLGPEFNSPYSCTKVEVMYEYFYHALEDLIGKLVIGTDINSFSVHEIIEKQHILTTVKLCYDTITIPLSSHIGQLDFCHQVIMMHEGDVFLKPDGKKLYVTLRMPL
jgi:hypothetical protein